MSTGVAITGTGVTVPPQVLDNDELCAAFNEYVRRENERNADAITAGTMQPLRESSPDFIVQASGIVRRHIFDKVGILDPERMCPYIPERPDDQLSVQAEFGLASAKKALEAAGRVAEDVDLIILASSSLQRMYPALGMEVQGALGARGYAFDISVGCSSATFPMQLACDAVRAGNATCALLVNPEIMSGHANWRDRDSHFIFGDAATAVVIEPVERAVSGDVWEILGTRLMSKYSSNIRNNAGYLNRCDPEHRDAPDKLFYQQGRKVFKDVVPMASDFIARHVESLGLDTSEVSRYWLHQANANMNRVIAKRLLGRDASPQEAPIILDEFGNTASCGSIIAFNRHHEDLAPGSTGVICSFGAGYSIGSVAVRRR